MSKITRLYFLLVCLITVIIMIVTSAFMVNKLTDIIIPDYKLMDQLFNYESNEQYIKFKASEQGGRKNLARSSEEEVSRFRVLDKDNYIKKTKYEAISEFIRNFNWFIVAAIFFIAHWRMNKKYSYKD